MNSQQAPTVTQQDSSSSPVLHEQPVLQMTGAEFAIVRSLLQRNHDDLLSRLRDSNMGLSALDSAVARFAQQRLATLLLHPRSWRRTANVAA